MSRPSVPERLHRQTGDSRRAGDVHAGAVGQADSFAGGAGTGHGEVPRGGEGAGGAGHIPVYQFQHKERKDDVANNFGRQRSVRDGIVFIGVAQEKAQAFNGKKINGQFEFTRDKTVYVNHYYFYIDDEDFGPLFLKVCSYAPWGTKLCLNGHEWAKRQLEKKEIAYEALDNGFLSCADPEKLQQICDSLGPEDIDRVFRKWLRRIPLPLRPEDREAGYDWDSVDLADGSQSDADLRPALAWT